VRFVFGSLLVLFLFGDVSAANPLPAKDNWKWAQVLDYINVRSKMSTSGCKVWLEEYTTDSYRLWERCGVSSTLSGITRESILFGGFSGTIQGTGNIAISPVYSMCTWGAANNTSVSACDVGVSGTQTIVAGFSYSTRTPPAAGNGSSPGQEVYEKIVGSCTGTLLAGSVASGPYTALGNRYHFGTGTTASRMNNTGSTASSCLAGDALVKDFGNVTTSCTTAGGTITATFRGRAVVAGACNCIPKSFGIDVAYPGGSCIFRNVTGDPSVFGTNAATPGSALAPGSGHNFTSADILNLPSGAVGIPVMGDDTGTPANWGATSTASGNQGSPAATGTGFDSGGNTTGTGSAPLTGAPTSGGGGGGGGAAPGTGSGNCAAGVANCNGDGTEDAGGVPGALTFGSGVDGVPEEGDWKQSIIDFMSGSPIVSALSSSGVSASGSCSVSGSVMGRSIDLSFCPWESMFNFAGGLLVLLSHIAAFWIVWKN
jgi:hypothetical protein